VPQSTQTGNINASLYSLYSLSCAPSIPIHPYIQSIHTAIMGEGLTRRRAGAGGSPTTTQSDQIPSSSNHNSSSSSGNGNKNVPTPSASGTGGRVAYDPRDFQDDAESNKMPRLTLMEEVLLLGLKDKAVRQQQPLSYHHPHEPCHQPNEPYLLAHYPRQLISPAAPN